MKLIFCTPLTPTTANGETIYTARVLRALHTLGLEMEVVMISFYTDNLSPSEDNWFQGLKELETRGVKFTVFPAKPNGLSFLKAYFKLFFYVFKEARNINIIAFRSFWFQPIIPFLKVFNRKVVSLWFHDGIVEEYYFVHPDMKHRIFVIIASLFEKIGAYFVDWEFPVSEKMRTYSFKKGIQGRKGSVVLPCVVEIEKFAPRLAHSISLTNPIIIGYSGSLSPWHGFEDGCRFLSFLDKNYKIKLHVLTTMEEIAKKILSKFSLDYIIESTMHDEVPHRMDKWHFALVPTIDGLRTQCCSPLKATEALAKGLPLIITRNVGDFSDIVKERGVGVVFDQNNKESWLETLREFKKVLDNYEEASKKARSIAIEHYSWDILPQQLRSLLNI